jgi:hypothetical protein
MRDFEASTLWRVSEFERVRLRTGNSGFTSLDGSTVLPTTLLAELRRLDADGASNDVLEVVAACVRHRESALLCLQVDGLVWPVTLFPDQTVYHSPRDISLAAKDALARATLISTEPPGVRPPGHYLQDRIANPELYRPLSSLLWRLALHGPRDTLLAEIAGTAAYRAVRNLDDGVAIGGSMRSAFDRLRRETVPLRTIAGWPGMSSERASRLLNGLYLASSLLATRGHPAARPAPRSLLDVMRGARPRR